MRIIFDAYLIMLVTFILLAVIGLVIYILLPPTDPSNPPPAPASNDIPPADEVTHQTCQTYLCPWGSTKKVLSHQITEVGDATCCDTLQNPELGATVAEQVASAAESNMQTIAENTEAPAKWASCPEYANDIISCNMWQLTTNGALVWPPSSIAENYMTPMEPYWDINYYAAAHQAKGECSSANDDECCFTRVLPVAQRNGVKDDHGRCPEPTDCQELCQQLGREGSNRRCFPTNNEPGRPNQPNGGWAWDVNLSGEMPDCTDTNLYKCVCSAK